MDQLIKALALNEQVRVYITNTIDIVNTAVRKHDLWPSSTSVLGKVLTMGVIMGGMLKNDAAITIKLRGNGYLGNVVVDSNALGQVRGYVDNPHITFDNNNGGLNDEMAIGNEGMMDIIKDLKLKDLFTSSIEITGNIANDFTYYFYESEQTKSIVCLAIEVGTDNFVTISGGLVIQLLPNATEDVICELEQKISSLSQFRNLIKTESLENIIDFFFPNDYTILETMPISFHCNCSKESFAAGLKTLNVDVLNDILNTDHHIETVCHYCGEKYQFDESEIKQLIKEIKK